MQPATRSPVWAQDLMVGIAAGAVWFAVITVLLHGSYWHPTSIESYRWAGVWIVATLALRRVTPGPLFWITVMFYPLFIPWQLQSYFQLLPILVVGFAAARAGAAPAPLLGIASGLSAWSLYLVNRPQVRFPFHPGLSWLAFLKSPSDVLVVEALALGAVVAGVVFRRLALTSEALAERNAELQALQGELAQQAVLTERTRIARELHDVVAHHMSAIVVRAQAADRVAPNQPQAPAEAVRWIAGEGKQALAAMRSVVHVLRRDPTAGPELAPTPDGVTVADELRASARRVQDAGRDVDLDLPDPVPALPAEVGLAVVRITQEALTNVLLHSLAPQVSVTVRVADRALEVTVHDAGPPLPDAPGGGHGLGNMSERAATCGGVLRAGPDSHGGWLVVATLPTAPATAAEPVR